MATPSLAGLALNPLKVTPMNYFGLLTMLESIGYYSAAEKKCLRASDVYSAVSCPDGYVKRAEACGGLRLGKLQRVS